MEQRLPGAAGDGGGRQRGGRGQVLDLGAVVVGRHDCAGAHSYSYNGKFYVMCTSLLGKKMCKSRLRMGTRISSAVNQKLTGKTLGPYGKFAPEHTGLRMADGPCVLSFAV